MTRYQKRKCGLVLVVPWMLFVGFIVLLLFFFWLLRKIWRDEPEDVEMMMASVPFW